MLPSAAFLAQRLASLNPRVDTEIAVYSDSAEDLQAAFRFGVPASLKYVDFTGRLPDVGRLSGAAFFRLFVPDVVDETVEKVLYLDTDIAVEDDRVFRLLDLDLKGHPVAAVRDVTMSFNNTIEGERELALTGASRKYLNSGVLLIDRAAWRKRQLGLTVFERAIRGGFHDQTALNAILQGDWLELSPAMNMVIPIWNSFVRKVFPPSVVHFMGKTKPWDAEYVEDHPVRADMLRYFANSPWPRFIRHANFQQAWARQSPALARQAPARKLTLSPFADFEGMEAALRSTTFADVEQGISRFQPGEFPVRTLEAAKPPAQSHDT
jgi:lipopolysaccharide biosynthesis glycosyltransferase